jgi:hypothetical protein
VGLPEACSLASIASGAMLNVVGVPARRELVGHYVNSARADRALHREPLLGASISPYLGVNFITVPVTAVFVSVQ